MNKAFLGIDYGRVRIGLAISESGLIARPLKTIENKGDRKNLAALAEIIKQYNIWHIIIGLPVHKNTETSNEVRLFAKNLESLDTNIEFQNEMLSSVNAEEEIREKLGITDRKKIAQLIDSVAASMILNDYLKENNKNGSQN